MAERDGEDLVGPQAASSPVLAVDDVVEVAPASYQKRSLNEARTRSARSRDRVAAARCPALDLEPVGEQAQRVVPERVDLDRLAAPRRDDPVADLGVHPGQLIAGRPWRSRPSSGSTPMPKRVPAMWWSTMSTQRREQQPQSRSRSPVCAEVAVDGVEEPERGVGRVVEALVLALGEQVGDQAVAHVVGERPEDVAGLGCVGR